MECKVFQVEISLLVRLGSREDITGHRHQSLVTSLLSPHI